MNPLQFLDMLDGALSEAEMGALCRQFGVSFDAFPGATKRDKTREFLGYIGRQGRLSGLAEATAVLRPDLTPAIAQLYEGKEQELAWLDQVTLAEGQALESGLTWRWSASSGLRAPASGSTYSPAGDGPQATVSNTIDPRTVIPPNPYTPGKRVADETMFFGRAAEREQLRQLAAEGGHGAIIGERGYGGSSLLHHVAHGLARDNGLLVAAVDMKDRAHHSLGGLLNAIWMQWWGRVKPGNNAPIRTLAEFVTAVRKLNAAGFRPKLFLDELEQLTWRPMAFDDNLLNAWHELGREGLMGFVFTTHSPPADVLVQSGFGSKFYELFQPVTLGLLEAPAPRDLLTVPLQNAGFTIPDGVVDDLLEQAGPHPFFLHLAGLYLFDALAHSTYSRAGVNRLFETAAEPYWQEMWESLSPLAQVHYPPAGVRFADGMAGRQLRILANKGLIISDDAGFRPFSEGFARWLRRMQAAMEAAATAVADPSAV